MSARAATVCLVGCAATVLCACAGDRSPAAPRGVASAAAPSASEPPLFDVRLDRGSLYIETRLPAGAHVTTDESTFAWVHDVEARGAGAAWRTLAPAGSEYVIPACGPVPTLCSVRYRFDLASCAREVNEPETAAERDGALVAPSSSFLLLPAGDTLPAHRFCVHGDHFASGAVREPGTGAGDPVYREDEAGNTLPVNVFAAAEVDSFTVGAASFDVAFTGGDLAVGRAAFVARIERTAARIAGYEGRFPAPHTLVVVTPTERRHDSEIGGLTLGGGGGDSVLLGVPGAATAADLARDWVTTHELLHVAFPTVGRPHRWMEEGLSTYLEPVIRVRDGTVDGKKFWGDLVDGLPQGVSAPGAPGLENTATWASTYWGGALYWFAVDLAIRRSSHGQRSLRDALAAIARAGGHAGERWTIERVVSVGDEGSKTMAMRDELGSLGETGAPVDLAAIWRSLGIRKAAGSLVFDDGAPEASFRSRIASGE